MATLNLSLDAFNMDPSAVADAMQDMVKLVQEIEEYTEFMTNKITAVNDQFASRNYDMIVDALNECKGKLQKASEELSDLVSSCNSLVEKIEAIEA